nr:T9SS type A sorting domain-containing protein [Bacteroidota bacterium]
FDPVTAGSYVFTLTVTNEFECSASCDFEIIVNPLPVADCPGFDAVCEGSAVIEFPIVEGGVYTDENGNVVTSFDPVVAGNYVFTLTVTNEFECSASCGFEIMVNTVPISDCPIYDAVCEGSPVIGFPAVVGGVYTNAAGNPVTGFDPVTAETYGFTLTVTNEFGCVDFCNFEIVVIPLPFADAGPPLTISTGDSVLLSNSDAGNYDILTWATNGDGIFNNPNILHPIYTPGPNDIAIGNVTLELTATGNLCGDSTDQMTLTIVSCQATVEAGENATICEDGALPLMGAATNYVSIEWSTSGDGTFTDPTSLETVYIPGPNDIENGSATLCLTAFAEAPCENAFDCLMLTITPLPEIDCPDDFTVCIDENPWILSGATPEGGVFTGSGVTNNIFNPESAGDGTHEITYTYSENSCEIFCNFNIMVEALPDVTVMPHDTNISLNELFTFTEVAASGYATLQWSTSGTGSFDDPAILNPTYTPSTEDEAGGWVILALTASNEYCEASDEMTLTIGDCMIPPLANAGGDATICGVGNITLSGQVENDCGHYWETSGDGSFDDNAMLGATYLPGPDDYLNGTVELCLFAEACAPCVLSDDDCIMLYLSEPPVVEITFPLNNEVIYFNPIVEGIASDPEGTIAFVEVSTNNGPWLLASGTTSWSLEVILHSCNNTIRARATDMAGCQSEIYEIEVLGSLQKIPMFAGWSVVSSYLEPVYPDMGMVAQDITPENNLVIAVNNSANIFWPVAGVNTIGNWNSQNGYKIKSEQNGEWIIRGDPVANSSLDLLPGNLFYLPVLTNIQTPIDQVFENPVSDIFFIYSIQTNQIYWPDGGILSLTELTPGFGYYAYMKNNVTANFPPVICDPVDQSENIQFISQDGPWTVARTSEVHLFAIDAAALSEIQEADYLGAFDTEGNCIGYASIMADGHNALLTVYGDDQLTDQKDGAIENELIQFRTHNTYNGHEETVIPVFDKQMPQYDGLYVTYGASKIIKLTTISNSIAIHDISGLIHVFPNPARNVVTIDFPLFGTVSGKVSVEFFNTEGLSVKKEALTGTQTGINVSGLAPGVYILKLENTRYNCVKRLVIQ